MHHHKGCAAAYHAPRQPATTVNPFPEPDRPVVDDPGPDPSLPAANAPYKPMSVSGPPPASTVASDLMTGVLKTLAVVGMGALSGRSFSVGGGRVYTRVYAY